MKTNIRLLLLLLLTFVAITVFGDDFSDLKETIQLRAPAVQELKSRGLLSEGANGLLEAGSNALDPAQQNILDLENSDRTKMFQLIAERNHTTPEEVAQTFGRMAAAALQPAASTAPMSAAEPSASQPAAPDSGPSSPMSNDRTAALPLKVLTRPFANIYAAPQDQAQKVRENVPAFSAFYVYQKTGGWYQVGADNHGSKTGWMREADVIEWKQNLVVEFTHPEGRQPVLMFSDSGPLRKIVGEPKDTRSADVTKLYDAITAGSLPPDFPVRTMEPRRSVQSKDQFYLLPILGYEESEIDGREGRILQLAAATRKRGAVELANDSDRAQLNRDTDVASSAARNAQVDVVFVMDLTRSMGPFAARTVDLINQIINRIGADEQANNAIRFGFWGYRDFPELCHGIGYNTRNYTPDLQSVTDFAVTLKGVQETKVDSIDYEEDVLSGVADAIQHTNWRPGALRQIILVGDAPGRRPGEKDPFYRGPNAPVGTKCGMNEDSIRKLANDQNVYVSAIYLRAPRWSRYAEIGASQFRTLARNPNDQPGQENFYLVNVGTRDDQASQSASGVMDNDEPRKTAIFGSMADSLANGLVDSVLALQGRGGTVESGTAAYTSPDNPVDSPEAAEEAGREMARNMFHGALVQWLGKQDPATVPRDVTVWASDKDLVDPTIQSLDVEVFLTKDELNSLKLVMDRVLDAGTRGKITGEDFFQALRAVVAAAASDPEQIQTAETLAKTGLVPDFLKGLPYRSTLMDMSNDSWRNMPPDEQNQFLHDVESKLHFYQAVHDDSDKWQALNEGDDRDNWVAAIPLEELP
jgi:uncharacterized protein YdbL (DUF1318 family)